MSKPSERGSCTFLLITLTTISLFFSSYSQSLTFQCDAITPESKEIPPRLPYHVIKKHPHRSDAFTQGLLYRDGKLYESTGLYGQSTISSIDLNSGVVRKHSALEPQYFGEGLTLWQNQLIWLTWKSGKVFRYRASDMTLLSVQTLPNNLAKNDDPVEGWGITHNNEQLITSNGSEQLVFRHPETLTPSKVVTVYYRGRPLKKINELAWVNGCVLANIWQSPYVAIINPNNGQATALIDLSPLLEKERQLSSNAGVANGIAFMPEEQHLLISGKNWQHIYQLKMLHP